MAQSCHLVLFDELLIVDYVARSVSFTPCTLSAAASAKAINYVDSLDTCQLHRLSKVATKEIAEYKFRLF